MLPEQIDRAARFITRILRHTPHQFGIDKDRDGWVSLSDLTLALERFDVGEVLWSSEFVAHLLSVSNANARFQITVNRGLAAYGHSCSQFHLRETGTPDVPLYHGTRLSHGPTGLTQ